MLDEFKIEELTQKLNTDEYIVFERFNTNGCLSFFISQVIRILTFLVCAIPIGLILQAMEDNYVSESVMATVNIVLFILLILAVIFVPKFIVPSKNMRKQAKELEQKIKTHNEEVYNKFIANELKNNDITNFNKEIKLHGDTMYSKQIESFGVNTDEEYFAYYKISIHLSTGKKSFIVKKAYFKDIIRFEVIDKSTSKQIAQSSTSSNSGKAIGGAIVSGLLFDEATTGAIIGASGKKSTETISKTVVDTLYQIVIYLNSLENSLLTIDTKSRDRVNEIVAVLEYIIRNQNNN